MKGMIDIFNEKYDRYEEKQRCFLNSYFFLSHIMALDIRQKLQKLWFFSPNNRRGIREGPSQESNSKTSSINSEI